MKIDALGRVGTRVGGVLIKSWSKYRKALFVCVHALGMRAHLVFIRTHPHSSVHMDAWSNMCTYV